MATKRPVDQEAYRVLPSVDRVLRAAPVAALLGEFAREPVLGLVRRVLEESRAAVAAGRPAPSLPEIASRVASYATVRWQPSPRPVINATGVILHTNLGRAPLGDEALAAMRAAAAYSDLELDLSSGKRGSRQDHATELLLALTGAKAAHVAVNNAAAVLLALAALARGKEVLVSRGQAVEIGGGFRVPVILRQSGARLVEVGTTNRTRISDFEEAISARTGAILHVHSSNFRITGFTEQVSLHELSELAKRHAIPLIDDNGSGPLLDTADFGLAHEPTPVESLAAGSDLVAFSADKLLGGPQAGVLLGREEAIKRIRKHPLARAVRPDKMTLAALSATLLAYLRGDAARSLPVWRMIGLDPAALAARADAWRSAAAARGVAVTTEPGESTVGGGSLPGETLPTTLLVLPPSVSAAALRQCESPVMARTRVGRVLLDLRTVAPDQDSALLEAVCAALQRVDRPKNAVLESVTT